MPRKYARKRSYARRARRYYRRPRVYRSRALRPELKRIETQLSASTMASIPSTGVYLNFVKGLAQGTDYNKRIGDKVAIMGWTLYGQLEGGQSNLATDDSHNFIRIMFLSTQQGAALSPTPNFDLPINRQTVTNLIAVYMSKMFSLYSPGRDSTGYMPALKMVKMSRKCRKPIVIKFSQGGSTTPSFDLLMYATSDSGVVPNPGFSNGWLRVFYVDG